MVWYGLLRPYNPIFSTGVYPQVPPAATRENTDMDAKPTFGPQVRILYALLSVDKPNCSHFMPIYT